jgi:hypothetical protein
MNVIAHSTLDYTNTYIRFGYYSKLITQNSITFLSPLQGVTSSTVALRVTPQSYSFYSTRRNRLTMVSMVASIVISKFLHCTILVTISAKSFFQQNFNLKWTRIQRGPDLGFCWMLFFTVEKVC